MIKTLLSLSVVCLLSLVTISSATEDLQHYAEYFAGVQLLSSDKVLTPQQKALRYKKLSEISGITADQAKLFLNQYKNNPAQWKEFQKTVLAILQKNDEKQTTTSQNGNHADTVKQKDSLLKVNSNKGINRTVPLLKVIPSRRKS